LWWWRRENKTKDTSTQKAPIWSSLKEEADGGVCETFFKCTKTGGSDSLGLKGAIGRKKIFFSNFYFFSIKQTNKNSQKNTFSTGTAF
jgi:hypothetical protein